MVVGWRVLLFRRLIQRMRRRIWSLRGSVRKVGAVGSGMASEGREGRRLKVRKTVRKWRKGRGVMGGGRP